jgi:hypothetical protein
MGLNDFLPASRQAHGALTGAGEDLLTLPRGYTTMAANMATTGGKGGNRLRPVIWGTAAFLLLLPLVAMQFTTEVKWTGIDFVAMGILLLTACSAYELGTRMSSNWIYRLAFGSAVIGGFLEVWVNVAVGMVGSEANHYNRWFGLVLLVGVVGALSVRFRPRGMVGTLLAMALVQVVIAAVALVAGWDPLGSTLSGLFAGIWLVSAALFHWAGQQPEFARRAEPAPRNA